MSDRLPWGVGVWQGMARGLWQVMTVSCHHNCWRPCSMTWMRRCWSACWAISQLTKLQSFSALCKKVACRYCYACEFCCSAAIACYSSSAIYTSKHVIIVALTAKSGPHAWNCLKAPQTLGEAMYLNVSKKMIPVQDGTASLKHCPCRVSRASL